MGVSIKSLTVPHAWYMSLHFTRKLCKQCHFNITCAQSREIVNFTRNILRSKVVPAVFDPLWNPSYSSLKENLLLALCNVTLTVTPYPTVPYSYHPTLPWSLQFSLLYPPYLILSTLPHPAVRYPILLTLSYSTLPILPHPAVRYPALLTLT